MQFKVVGTECEEEIKEVRLEQERGGDVYLQIGENYVLKLSAADKRIELVGYCDEDNTGMPVDEDGFCPVFAGGKQLFPKTRKR